MNYTEIKALRQSMSYEELDDLMLTLVINYVYGSEPTKEEAKELTRQIKERLARRLDLELKQFV